MRIYLYSLSGDREYLGEWHTHPVDVNLANSRQRMDFAYDGLMACLNGALEEKTFWINLCNLASASYERARREAEVHHMLASDWLRYHSEV